MEETSPDILQHNNTSKLSKAVRRIVRDLFTTIIPALLIAFFINVYFAEAALVKDGPSMQPNLYRGNRVMIEKISYQVHPPNRGDVIITERTQGEVALIKRVIALPGETISVTNGYTYIDGEIITEPWVASYGGPDYPETVIPEGHVFIMGDNRNNSRDSRIIGPVPTDIIKGRVWMVYWPIEEMEFLP